MNPSGGLIAKGHPLGATGLAQCAELCWQLKGIAGPRQVNKKSSCLYVINFGGLSAANLVTLPTDFGGTKPQ